MISKHLITMKYTLLTLFLLTSSLMLDAQSSFRQLTIDPADSSVFKLNAKLIYSVPFRESGWRKAGTAEFVIILDLDQNGKIVNTKSIAFGGVRSFVETAQKSFSRFTGKSFVAPDSLGLKARYIIPVVVREDDGLQVGDLPSDFIKLVERLSEGAGAGLLFPVEIIWWATIRCFGGVP